MKRKFLVALLMLFMVFGLVACNSVTVTPNNTTTKQDGSTTSSEVTKKSYNVQFYNGDTLLSTLRVKEDEFVNLENVPTVSVDGFALKGWSLTKGGEAVDLSSYAITGPTKLYAVLEEVIIDDGLNVDAVKEEGATYYLVVGWWETTALNEDGTPKVTSGLTRTIVKHWYQNLLVYLTKFGATEEELANIQFRNYSTDTVAPMGELVNADGDVDLMIGVGNNINSQAGVSLLDESNDNKVGGIVMSSVTAGRYVALLKNNPAAVSVFDWIKNYDQGKSSFLMETTLTVDEIVLAPSRDQEITYTVTIKGDTDKVSELKEDTDLADTSTVTVPEGKEFLGFALTENGEAAVLVALNALTLSSIKSLFTNGATELTLYPVFKDEVVVTEDLVVYIQVNGTNLTMPEAELLIAKYEESLEEKKNIRWVVLDAKADPFKEAVNTEVATGYIDVIIGGNNPLSSIAASTDGPLANASTGHFSSTNRKIIIHESSKNTELASDLYAFVTGTSSAYTLGIEFWRVGTWVAEEEVDTLEASMTTYLLTYFGVESEDALLSTYSLSIAYYESGDGITKVAPLSEEARTLKNGKAVDLIVGCGGNVADEGNMVEASAPKDIPASMVAAGRKVAYVNGNRIAKALYDNFFNEAPVEEEATE